MRKPVRTELRQRGARVGNDDIRNVDLRLFFADDADRAVFRSLGDILMPVGLEAGDGHKQAARRHLARVILHVGDLKRFVRAKRLHGQAL